MKSTIPLPPHIQIVNYAKIHLIIITKKTGKIQSNLQHIFLFVYEFPLEIFYIFIITYFTKMSITEILFFIFMEKTF